MSKLPPTVTLKGGHHAIDGKVTRVLFQSPYNSGVLVQDSLSGRPVPVVGTLPELEVGDALRAAFLRQGHDARYNRESLYVVAESVIIQAAPEAAPAKVAPDVALKELPLSLEVIAEYLAAEVPGQRANELKGAFDRSGLAPERIVSALNSGNVRDLESWGIGRVSAGLILSEWRDRQEYHLAATHLMSAGLNRWQATQALRHALGSMASRSATGAMPSPLIAARAICAHPYRLSSVPGISFDVAVGFASKLGARSDGAGLRMAAAREAFDQATREGHTAQFFHELCEGAAQVIERLQKKGLVGEVAPEGSDLPVEIAKSLQQSLEGCGLIAPFGLDGPMSPITTPALHEAERVVAAKIIELCAAGPVSEISIPPAEELTKIAGFKLHPNQEEAIKLTTANRFTVLTGGPGCGKTTVLKTICRILQQEGKTILAGAPTGAAAKRLQEVTGVPARTMNSLLKLGVSSNGAAKRGLDQIDADVLILDEGSLMDAYLAREAFAAVGPKTSVILVGDEDQIPSVGPGAILANAIHSGVPPVARLTAAYRGRKVIDGEIVEETNPIYDFAYNIRDGISEIPEDEAGTKFGFKQASGASEAAAEAIDRVVRLRDKGVPMRDIVVLTAMNKGPAGVNALNERIQAIVNPGSKRGGVTVPATGGMPAYTLAEGDQVMFRDNNQKLDLVNGDIGEVLAIKNGGRSVLVAFGDRTVELKSPKLAKLRLCYAMTMHKSQGCEYKHVAVLAPEEHRKMLRRNLIYTAVTRAKKSLLVAGSKDVIIDAIHQVDDTMRRTLLLSELVSQAALNGRLTPYEDTIEHEPLPQTVVWPREAQQLRQGM